MTDYRFIFNRFILNRRISGGYRYQFEPFGGGHVNEPYFSDAILQKGDLFIDIGANSGGWTIPAARYYRQVVAFEANPKLARVLVKNLRLNNVSNVIVHPIALGDERATRKFWHYATNGQDSFLFTHTGIVSTGKAIPVEVKPLDDYFFKPTVVKIDTEGYELNVLEGALGTIQRTHPRLAIETHAEADVDQIETMLPQYVFEHIRREAQPGTHLGQTILIGQYRR